MIGLPRESLNQQTIMVSVSIETRAILFILGLCGNLPLAYMRKILLHLPVFKVSRGRSYVRERTVNIKLIQRAEVKLWRTKMQNHIFGNKSSSSSPSRNCEKELACVIERQIYIQFEMYNRSELHPNERQKNVKPPEI